jgi:hypothetical protein
VSNHQTNQKIDTTEKEYPVNADRSEFVVDNNEDSGISEINFGSMALKMSLWVWAVFTVSAGIFLLTMPLVPPIALVFAGLALYATVMALVISFVIAILGLTRNKSRIKASLALVLSTPCLLSFLLI